LFEGIVVRKVFMKGFDIHFWFVCVARDTSQFWWLYLRKFPAQ
jgi:hypothetical protein